MEYLKISGISFANKINNKVGLDDCLEAPNIIPICNYQSERAAYDSSCVNEQEGGVYSAYTKSIQFFHETFVLHSIKCFFKVNIHRIHQGNPTRSHPPHSSRTPLCLRLPFDLAQIPVEKEVALHYDKRSCKYHANGSNIPCCCACRLQTNLSFVSL